MKKILLDNISWIFDGIGTTMVSSIISLIIGIISGFFIGKNFKIKQIQKGKDYVDQNLIGVINCNESDKTRKNTSVYQKQVSRDNSEQIQIGEINVK